MFKMNHILLQINIIGTACLVSELNSFYLAKKLFLINYYIVCTY